MWHLALQKYMAAAYQDKAKTKINTWESGDIGSSSCQ